MNSNGCQSNVPYGVGGHGPFPCPGVRDHGTSEVVWAQLELNL